jgi:hypothetical protein
MTRFSSFTLLFLLVVYFLSVLSASGQVKELKRYDVREARQAAAVDRDFFYAINNSTILKYRKSDGRLAAEWDGSVEGIKHLNSGVVIKGKLYCANSNYPDSPMAGSIEIFDTKTLQHIGNHSFGIYTGSVTWIDQWNGYWYVGFAHYTGRGSSEGKDNRWTSVVKFSKKWQRVESWIFPENIIELFANRSNSGAAWGRDGKLYCTGHDNYEIYVMEIPRSGYTLRHVRTIPALTYGQGITFDRSVKDKMVLYGIGQKNENLVIAFEVE